MNNSTYARIPLMRNFVIALPSSMLVCGAVSAKMYKWTGAEGNVNYT